jgi:hypothetical protein
VKVTIKSDAPRDSAPVGRLAAPYLVWLLLHSAAAAGAMYSFRSTWFYHYGPGGSPPWYFIGQDAVDAAWSSAAAVLMLAFAFASVRRLGPGVWACLGVALIGFVGKVGAGANILLHTRQLWDASYASSDWTSFDAYLSSRETSFSVSLCIGVVLSAACILQYGRSLRAAGGVH